MNALSDRQTRCCSTRGSSATSSQVSCPDLQNHMTGHMTRGSGGASPSDCFNLKRSNQWTRSVSSGLCHSAKSDVERMWHYRCRAKREHLWRFHGLLCESPVHNLALTALCVPDSLDSGTHATSLWAIDGVRLKDQIGNFRCPISWLADANSPLPDEKSIIFQAWIWSAMRRMSRRLKGRGATHSWCL